VFFLFMSQTGDRDAYTISADSAVSGLIGHLPARKMVKTARRCCIFETLASLLI
jgi:hypothetical protein